jgi:ribonuclease HI
MKQLSFFDTSTAISNSLWTMHIDGASRNNPGPAGVGIVIDKDNEPIWQEGFYIGTKTNNQAEYLALVIGLWWIQMNAQKGDALTIFSDSQLLVYQLQGKYTVKSPDLVALYRCAQNFMQGYRVISTHVLREYNTRADMYANKGIDEKKSVPVACKQALHQHGIFI